MTPQEFYDACENFDWFYEMSDDYRVYRRGEAAMTALLAHAPSGSINRAIWDAWVQYRYSGPNFGIPEAQKPVRPL